MPIDINALRVARGADPQIVRDSEAKRFPAGEDPKYVDQVLELDAEWIKLANELDNKRAEKNKVNKEVGAKKKAKEECDDLVAQSKALSGEVSVLEEKVKEVRASVVVRGRIRHCIYD
jgi:seryl-tRNA synthetase